MTKTTKIDKDKLNILLDTFKSINPRVQVYGLYGRKIFDMRASDGSIVPAFMMYLVEKPEGHKSMVNVYGIKLDPNWTDKQAMQEIKKCDKIFNKQLKENKARQYNSNGGALGLEDNKK